MKATRTQKSARAGASRALKLRDRRSTCPISFSLDLMGDRWTLLIVRDIVFTGKKTFGEFLRSDERIATNILADRLSRLVCAGVLQWHPGAGASERAEYRLTERGIGLVPVLVDLAVWGATHDPETGAPPEFIAQAEHHREELLAAVVAGLKGTGPAIFAGTPNAPSAAPGPSAVKAAPVRRTRGRGPRPR